MDEIMERIREEIRRRRQQTSVPPGNEVLSPDQEMIYNNNFINKWVQLESALQAAEQVSQVGTRLPGMYTFRGWRRKIATFAGNVFLRLSQVITRDQRAYNTSVLNAIRSMEQVLKDMETQSKKLSVNKLNEEITGINHKLISLEQTHGESIRIMEAELSELKSQLNGDSENAIKIVPRINSIESMIGQLQNTQNLLSEKISGIIASLNNLESQVVKQITNLNQQLNNLSEEKLTRFNYQESRINEALQKTEYLKKNLLLQERRLGLLLEEARQRLPEPFSPEQSRTFIEKASDIYDGLYMEFEDHFRGTREDIKERQKVFIPLIQKAGAGTQERPILDLGCGRGEWLELLKAEGLIARGVDINKAMIMFCQELGLAVTQGDVLDYIRTLPNESIGAVTGFHIVEHLAFEHIINLFDETVRVLKPGGVAIFETPNPENILVGSCNFYFDPSHRNPLPSPMLKFLAEARGLCHVEIINLHPYPEAFKLSGSDVAERLNQLFYGPQDYAVVGWKA
ncbi:methyltransferase domain-containing protein [Desulfofundulus thermobenzoicus]|uniref:methyltransferase domain-containing protein n=1 Tax=Desulfofundulus thermobenzoicus TaxID=29376 RepID=UPI0018840A55